MCGRYSLTSAPEALRRLFGFDEVPNLRPRFNMAPTQAAPVIIPKKEGGRSLSGMRWGLIPSWAKEMGTGQINARSETVHEKPTFRAAFKRRRCLVPADGFYEWRKVADSKQPYRIFVEDAEAFAFAGIWDEWMSPDGSEVHGFAVLTTEAAPSIAHIHHRMPVILDPQDYDTWMLGEPGDLADLLHPAPSDIMAFHPVSTRVNNVANDDADLLIETEEIRAEAKKPEPPKQGSLF